jgi:hypothetical protein
MRLVEEYARIVFAVGGTGDGRIEMRIGNLLGVRCAAYKDDQQTTKRVRDKFDNH